VAVGVGDVVVVGVGDVVVVGVGVGDVVAVAVAVAVRVGDVDPYVAEYVLTGWVTPAFDDALFDDFGCLLADAEADALLATLVDETCAAGDWPGVCVCPPCALRAKAVPAPAITRTPMTAARTSDRDRRRGRPPPPDAGSVKASGGEPSADAATLSVFPYGGVTAELAIAVCVAPQSATGTTAGTGGPSTEVGAGVPSTEVGPGPASTEVGAGVPSAAVGADGPATGARAGGAANIRTTESGSQFPAG
jgi:hypothetical protein